MPTYAAQAVVPVIPEVISPEEQLKAVGDELEERKKRLALLNKIGAAELDLEESQMGMRKWLDTGISNRKNEEEEKEKKAKAAKAHEKDLEDACLFVFKNCNDIKSLEKALTEANKAKEGEKKDLEGACLFVFKN